ncbi:MAG: SusD/RagB family nutrient-binding outer membrane lipoprotein [Spirosomataceae bacterium]
MKKIFLILAMTLTLGMVSCEKSEFEKSYADPSKISQTTVEKQFAGFLNSNQIFVLPAYTNYFVVLRLTLNRYNQAVGWANEVNQYTPGAGLITDRWNNFYGFVAQFRELEKVYAQLNTSDQNDRRIYKIASTIYFYDHAQRVIDLHGDIPLLTAGMLSTNGGDYSKSFAKYDAADALYTKMLDDLKGFSDELNTITVSAGILTGFKTQDIINKGSIDLWKKYCNSMRLRMLTRVSDATAFQARAKAEIAEILGNTAKYPVVATNTDNIQLNVYDISTSLNSKGFQTGLEDWNGNIASKKMIDHMNANADPRLRAIFEPGINAKGSYNGLDQMLDASTQTALIAGGTIAIYNRSTLSRNQFCPGPLINAAEISFMAAEFYLKNGNNTAAKAAYEAGIKQSTEYFYKIRSVSNDNTAGALAPTNDAEIAKYIAGNGVNWANATTDAERLSLIATQKWIHYNVYQAYENWAETRRLDLPKLDFQVDNSNQQKLPPYRWVYPSSEIVYNTDNYNLVKAKDNLTTKLFWDVK